MGLFDTLAGFLKDAIGNNRHNDPEDVLNVKHRLGQAGYYNMGLATEPHGYITKEMDDGIRRFQKDNALRVDGAMLPGGETERSLYKATKGRNAQEEFIAQAEKTRTEDTPYRDFRPAGRFGQPAQNVDATGRAKREGTASSSPDTTDTYSNTDFLDHYKKGSGTPVTITPKEMDSILIFKGAMDQNRKSFEDSILKGEVMGDNETKKSPFKSMVENMKDGDIIYLDKDKVGTGDYWDQDIKRWDAAKSGDIKQSMAIGAVKLRSQGRLKAERQGDKILITGVVDHKVDDTYDFNKNDIILRPWEMLTHHGAKPFPIIGSRKDHVNAILTVKDGKITRQDFRWNPADGNKNAKPDQ